MNRVSPHRSISIEIRLPNEAALLGHLMANRFGDPAAIKACPTFIRDRLQGFGEIRLTPGLTGFVRLAAGAKFFKGCRSIAKFWQQFLDATRQGLG